MKKYFAPICLLLLGIFCTWNLAFADSAFRTNSMLRSGHPQPVSVMANEAVGEKIIAVTETEDDGNTKITDTKITKQNDDGSEDVMEEVTVEDSEKNSRQAEELPINDENDDCEYETREIAEDTGCFCESYAACGCFRHRWFRCRHRCCEPVSCCESCGTSTWGNRNVWGNSNWSNSACCDTACCEPGCCDTNYCGATICRAEPRHCGFRCRWLQRRAWRCCVPNFCAPTAYSACSSVCGKPAYYESIRPTDLSRTAAILPAGDCGCGR